MDIKKITASTLILTAMTAGGFELEKSSQLADIHAKTGVNSTLIIAAMKISDSHKVDVRQALVDEFNADQQIERDNLELHLSMVSEYFEELEADGKEPIWHSEPGKFTNEDRIKTIHESLTK